MSGLNTTTGEVSVKLPTIAGMSQDQFYAYCIVNSLLLILVVTLLCVYRMDYFHVISETRLEREIEKADRQHERDVIRYGIATVE